jgi:non-lysosomal glucosylceramidase
MGTSSFLVHHRPTRREFLIASTAAALGIMHPRRAASAGAPNRADFESLIPADKKLSPDWIKSLFDRGTPEVLRGDEWKFVAMPVGGIGVGHLYLGGDGRLWHWDIFNECIRTADGHYARPLGPNSPLTQKFSIVLDAKTYALDRTGFSDIRFRGQYPIGTVECDSPGLSDSVGASVYSAVAGA